jgi:hypothetical protein
VADPAARLQIEYLVSLSFPLVGNPSDLFKIVKKDSGLILGKQGQEPE